MNIMGRDSRANAVYMSDSQTANPNMVTSFNCDVFARRQAKLRESRTDVK
ncbi:MAG TPA: hypothetical protein PLO16_12235 [Acidocella sp.]|nr:hypothetical protein [Acidocella sp.]